MFIDKKKRHDTYTHKDISRENRTSTQVVQKFQGNYKRFTNFLDFLKCENIDKIKICLFLKLNRSI